MRCNGCGGLVGRDCFNPIECEWITDSMNRDNEEQAYHVPNLEYALELAEHDIYTLTLANEYLQQQIAELNDNQIR